MARKKTITKDQILNAAYDVVATEGFSRFTARNIASKMKCSTQPIYLEFKNMDDLKEALYSRIHDYLGNVILSEKHTGDPIIDLSLNYIRFACNEKVLYRALFIEDYSDSDPMIKFAYEYFMKTIQQDEELSQLDEEKKRGLLTGTWIVATGLASLMSSGLLNPDEQEIINMMATVIESIMKDSDCPDFVDEK